VLLVVLALGIAALTTATAATIAGGSSIATALRRSPSGIPAFVLGLVVLGLLWAATASLDASWSAHRGEVDALFLRYAGTARTAWAHATVAWTTWLLRWGIGLSIVAALTSAAVTRDRFGAALIRGMRNAVALRPLAATVAALVAGRMLWTAVYWRPRGLTANAAEVAFVSAKLGLIVLAAALLAVLVLHVHARAVTAARA
jgi:hypothetical protein